MNTSADASRLRPLLPAGGATIGSGFVTGLLRDDARNRHCALAARACRHDIVWSLGLRGGVFHHVSLDSQNPWAGASSGSLRVWVL